MGQARLVDDARATEFIIEPNRSVVFAFDLQDRVARSVAFEVAERTDSATEFFEAFHSPEIGQPNHKGTFDNLAAGLADELDPRFGGPACSDQVVDQKHTLSGLNGTDMHLDAIGPVFEFEFSPERLPGKLPWLAKRNEPKPESIRNRRPEDEAAGLDSYDNLGAVGPLSLTRPGDVGRGELVNRLPQRTGVLQ